jgi:hypothetical protein
MSTPPAPDATANPYALYAPLSAPDDQGAKEATKAVKKLIDERWKIANHRRYLFELKWLRNCYFAAGIQWNRIDWETKNVVNLKMPPNFPRSITNKYAKVNDDLASAIMQGEVPLNYLPAKDDPDAMAAADISERVREQIDVEVDVTNLKRDLAFWFVHTGNAGIFTYYDYNPEYGTKTVPQYTCTNPVCSAGDGGQPYQTLDATKPCPCGGPPPPPPMPPQIGPDGAPMQAPPPPPQPPFAQTGTQDMPIGKLCWDVLSPFEIYWDNTIRCGSQKQRWFIRPRIYNIETAKALWPEYAKEIHEGMNGTYKLSRNYLLAIAYAGSYLARGGPSGTTSGSDDLKGQCVAWEFRELPSTKYPQGLRGVVVGDHVVDMGPLTDLYTAGQLKGQPFIPLSHFYQTALGAAWGKARADDLVALQQRRNVVESNIQLTVQRTGSPKLMVPYGAGIRNVTGEAGQLCEYKPIGMGGTTSAEPHYLESALGNMGPLTGWLKIIDDAMEQIAGTFFLTGGDAPAGVTAASALSFLGERAHQAIAPVKDQWANAFRNTYGYSIEIIRTHWTDERQLAALGSNKEWQFEKFKAADLTGAIEVRVDYEALFPKSQATIRANIMQLVQMGIIQPGDAEVDFAVLEQFGLTELKKGMDEAVSQARREWDDFLNKDIQPVLIPMVQNAPIHLAQHQKDAQTQEFEQMYRTQKDKADMWIAHIQATQLEIVTAQASGAPPPGPPPKGGGAPPPAGHPGSQHGSQNGPAHGNQNLATAGPIKKGAAAADASGPAPAPGQ